jgi:hypothetical protein
MNMIITTGKHSYMVEKIDNTIEVGSVVFIPENKTWHMITAPGVMEAISETEIEKAVKVSTIEALTEAIATGGSVLLEADIDAPTAMPIVTDTQINLNGKTITVKEDIVGDGVFKVTEGTLTINGEGVINGLGNNGWSMAIWATDNGKVIINGGYFTNVGVHSDEDSEHFDLIYASGNGQIEINGGEFKCETPKWTLNIKDKDRATASIVVKGGKFYGFDPSNSEAEDPGTNFVAPGYKVVEDSEGIFVVVAE